MSENDKLPRITRDAFLFLTPRSEPQHEEFAQCGPCRMFVPEEYLNGKLEGSRCIIHGSKVEIDDDDSCGFMVPWPTPNGKPVIHVVKDHAAELLKIIPSSVTPKESGLVSRRVQCHRCYFAEKGVTVCGLYRQLNEEFPEIFNLDEKITRNSCCNAQEPKGEEPAELEDSMAQGELPVDEKTGHQAVRFERPSTHVAERCGNCEHFISGPPHRCQTVASPIFSNSWCIRWEAK